MRIYEIEERQAGIWRFRVVVDRYRSNSFCKYKRSREKAEAWVAKMQRRDARRAWRQRS